MLAINHIKEDLISQFPDYSFSITRRLTGRCIVAKETKYRGADIFVKKNRIVIEPGIPEWKTRLELGAGAVYIKMKDRNFSDVAIRLKNYLSDKYPVRIRN